MNRSTISFLLLPFLIGCSPPAAAPSVATPPLTQMPTVSVVTAAPPAVASMVTDTWVTYRDEGLGFALRHPATWEVCQDVGYSRLFCVSQTEPGRGPLPSLYVSVLANGLTDCQTNDCGDVYNFIAEDTVARLWSMPPGATVAIGEPASHWTFTRLADMTVAGEESLVLENQQVWEAGPTFKDRRVFLKHHENTYMFGAYYESPEELETFLGVLATFAFED